MRDQERSRRQIQCIWGGKTGGEVQNHDEAGERASSRHWQAQSKENEMTCGLERGRTHCQQAQMVTIQHEQQSFRLGVTRHGRPQEGRT
ncbi:hypothetical protein AHAS_Ahas02G0075400 [Arachis hypogaea]